MKTPVYHLQTLFGGTIMHTNVHQQFYTWLLLRNNQSTMGWNLYNEQMFIVWWCFFLKEMNNTTLWNEFYFVFTMAWPQVVILSVNRHLWQVKRPTNTQNITWCTTFSGFSLMNIVSENSNICPICLLQAFVHK